MISVLFMIPTLDRGGAENVLVDLVNSMDQSKFRITVQTLFDQDSQKDRLKKGIEYKSCLYHQFHGNSRILAMIPAKPLYQMIVREHYDIVVSYLEGPTAHILSGCPYSDSRKIAWIHVEMDNAKQASVGFKSLYDANKAYQMFDKMVFVAKTVQESFQKATGISYKNASVLYNTIDSDTIINKANDKQNVKKYAEDEFNIVSVGRIIEDKGFDRLANIQIKLKDLGYKTHVYILGEGKEKNSIESYIAKNAASDSFTFLGFKENPYPYVLDADLFVCSSRREGFSTAVTEALVLGVPVVSTNCSGAYELLGENNEYGIVTENNEGALFDGLKKLLDDSAELNHYRLKAKERGRMFSREITVKAVEEMLLNV